MLRPVPQSLPQPSTNPKKKGFYFSLFKTGNITRRPQSCWGSRGTWFPRWRGGGRGQGYIRHIYVTLDCTPIKRIERQERRHYTHDEMTPTPPLMPPYNRRNGSDDDDDVSCLREFSRTSGNNDLRGGKKRERIECFMERRRLTWALNRLTQQIRVDTQQSML
jgi:hypothetical protein